MSRCQLTKQQVLHLMIFEELVFVKTLQPLDYCPLGLFIFLSVRHRKREAFRTQI